MRPTRIWSGALLILTLVVLQACDETGTTPDEGDTYALTVTLDGLGIGTVTNDETGIACDTTGATCSADLPEGTAVTLTATAAPGSEFVGWGDAGMSNPLTVTMDADRSITAEFDNPDLAVQSVGASGGEVMSRDSAITLVFPAGALSGDEEITIERLEAGELGDEWGAMRDAGDIAAAYELGPDGLTFDVPVEVEWPAVTPTTSGDTLTIDVPRHMTSDGTNATGLDSTIARMAAGDASATVTTFVEHFSPLVGILGPRFEWDIPKPAYVDGFGSVTLDLPTSDLETYQSSGLEIVSISDNALAASGPPYQGQNGSWYYNFLCFRRGPVDITARAHVVLEDGTLIVAEVQTTVECLGQTLTVTTSGEGSGTVSGPKYDRRDDGITCGSQGSDCTEDYPPGRTIALTAIPDEGSYFAGWTVNDQVITPDGTVSKDFIMETDKTIDARFEPIEEEELTVSLDGSGDGTVTSDPAGIDCTKTGTSVSGTCTGMFDRSSTVTLTATDPDGSTITDWSGDGVTNALGQRVLEMLSTLSVEMNFPVVPSTTTLINLAATAVYYFEAMALVNLRFPFLQPAPELAWETAGEACPTVLVAGDGATLAVDACTGDVVQQYDFGAFSFYSAYALPRPEGETGDHAIFAAGQNYAFFWVDDTGAVTSQIGQMNWGTVPDVTAINGDAADGLAMIRDDGFGQTVRFVRYDPAKGYHDLLTDYVGVTTTPPNAQSVFATGAPADPQALPEEMLVVGNTSSEGMLYYIETTSEQYPTWQHVGALGGDNPRRIRCDLDSGICAVSDFANSLVTVILWSGTGMPTIGASTTGGQIASGPVGLDVYGNYIVTAGYNDDSYSIIEVDASGNVVNATTTALPAGCSAPGHAVFLRDAANTVLVSCNASQAIVRIPNAF